MSRDPAAFEEHRNLLFGIAYRMLGTVMDAQDMVQETYVRWQRSEPGNLHSPRAWLTTVITRLCLNHLQLARVQRETYVGPWLPEPLVDEHTPDPAEAAHLADTLSLAFLVLLETLSPTERAVFILREGFGCDFAEIAGVVEKSEANCRQILTRARKRIEERRPRYDVPRDRAEQIVEPFVTALRQGDLATMLAHLSEQVMLIADAGGRPGALLRPLQGAEAVARVMIERVRRHGVSEAETRPATVNGLPGFVHFQDGQPRAVLAFGIAGERIVDVFVMSNPDKLRHLTGPAVPSDKKR